MRTDQQLMREQLTNQAKQQAQMGEMIARLNDFFDKAAKR
jgi:hypothetical protein